MSQPTKFRHRLPVALGSGLAALALLVTACGQSGAPATPPSPSPSAVSPTASESPKSSAPASSPAVSASASPSQSGAPAIKITGPFEGEAKQLTGAGATFPAPIYTKWFEEYMKLTGVQTNYQAIGSGGGIQSISDQTVDFGASDGPMSDQQLAAAKGGEILHLPMVLGAVVPTYNIPGVTKQLKFTGDTLAGIYLGEITKWNDPKLVADNPDANLPNKDIVTVHRSDGSGTTFIWTDYLASVSPTWKSSVGTATSVDWPVAGLGGKGNEGVSGEVKQNPYAIGYVELIYALQNKLPVSLVKNKAGTFIEPNLQTTTAAAAGVADNIAPDLRASIVNAAGANAYPISSFTWMLEYKNMKDKAKAAAVTRLIWWGIHDGQKYTTDLGYAPLPEGIVAKVEAKIKSITVDGQPAFPGR